MNKPETGSATTEAENGGSESPPSARLGPMPARNPAQPSDPVRARAAGRPLDENVDAAILDTAWRLLLEEGYARMSIARVAEEARVGRPAIYRRYRDKAELVAAVLADKQSRTQPIDTGSARGDLIAHLEFARRRFAVELAGTMIVEGRKHPELLEGFRRGMLQPRLGEIVAALERGKERGEIRVDLDSEVAVHALMGAFMYYRIAEGQPKKGWSEHVVDTLWPAFAA
jgi:AcrR family transcriptional regulator